MTTDTETWLDRVQALLAKAESTEFPDEAEALMAKAQSLMSKHAIDEAMLDAAGRKRNDVIDGERIDIPAPQARPKAFLMAAIAGANDCRLVLDGGKGGYYTTVRLIGHESDREAVKILFASLSLYVMAEMSKAPIPEWDTVKRFRRAFVVGFQSRIGQRLMEARAAAIQEADRAQASGAGAAVVLAERAEDVNKFVTKSFGKMRTSGTTVSSSAGVHAGRAAANTANLGQSGVTAGGRQALGS